MTKPATVDEYISSFPPNIQEILKRLRSTVRKAAPKAAMETISYGMPTLTLQGNLVHYAAFKNHIGLYPSPSGIKAFEEKLKPYAGAKGSIRFPLDKPLPLNLISKIVKYRVEKNKEKAAAKVKVKKAETDDFLSSLAAPARRALENKGIKTIKQLAAFKEEQIAALHGMGPATLPKLRHTLATAGLSFQD